MAGASLFQVGGNVEFWRVLVHLSILAVFLLGFEAALHHLEHRLARYDKYHVMLQKVYRELMVLGLISLVLKILKEVAPIDSYSKPMIAFQVADLIIFGLAIALILQSICIFLQLRGHGARADQAELITTQDVLQHLQEQDNSFHTSLPLVKHRLLRQLFLHRFDLPELFPFSKYIRRAQATQISCMIEVEPSMWVLLLLVAWGVCGLAELLEDITLIKLLVVFSWILVLLHVVMMIYLRSCVRQLFALAGYSKDRIVLSTNLAAVAEQEASVWENISVYDAIETMNQVLDVNEQAQYDRKLTAATLWSNISSIGEFGHSRESGINIRFFSRKIWQAAVTFAMTLNGFFIALFVQCSLYNLDEIYKELGLVAAVMVPLPMLLNALVLQPYIFSEFVLVCSVLRIDTTALGHVIRHFSETIEMQSAFAASLVQCLEEGGLTVAYFEAVVESHDQEKSGFIEIDKLRVVLASVGFNITRFRLNSVVKLLFELKGTTVEYAQLFQLLSLVGDEYPKIQRFDHGIEIAQEPSRDAASTQQFSLLAQSSVASGLGDREFAYEKVGTPAVRQSSSLDFHGLSVDGRRPMLQRSYLHQFTGSSARMLRDMYKFSSRS
ncbi:hypothetical protein PF005_g9860 [Phytophthora fragariae]|uniref:EF-hand domain-containing protein n=1 Tax=Phytophthora fragariae TaxID=53985 RepID=A0A6A3L531_9STRA|nr:hypothetical protein PF003_g8659 [Phytophthora fragariae]KAE8939159.1 hypothetical protein PF009_g10993 [Phytophthora fragariae]KAE9013038.1 hypothetical protein PF011_g8661 [Phytophthora fragariae]KAE9115586.1 hypothetical protein PF007_g9980 [Phytophthora fragariae]KAE9115851.1 hypothetical protein PF010_g9187 [Phytophthora fragariae]